jgi:Holliday junction resolvase RusA-like endonuclease
MIPVKETTIDIHPSTHVRSTKNENWLLSDHVTYEYLEKCDEKKLLREIAEGKENPKRGTLAARKKQLEINKLHKQEINSWAVRNSFTMPLGYAAVWFYVPMPASWRKKKRAEMLHTIHQSTPDLDNYLKQLYDAIMPRKNRLKKEKGCDDRKVHNYATFKVWVEWDEACHKIIEYRPAEFLETFKHGHPAYNAETGCIAEPVSKFLQPVVTLPLPVLPGE